MMRYALYLVACGLVEAIAIPLALVVPLAARDGWLPWWLWWFQTPDNSLHGDRGWEEEHWQWRHRLPDLLRIYVGYVGWLLRNRAYGFKWSYLAAPVEGLSLFVNGDLAIKNRQDARAGWFHIEAVGEAPKVRYWQWKWIWPIPRTTLCVMLSLGWLLDPYKANPRLHETQPRALFMFSPRLSAFHPNS